MYNSFMLGFGKNREEKPSGAVVDVHKQAEGIIEEANKKAEQIVRETQFFTRKLESDFRKSLEETTAVLAEQSHNHMESIVSEYGEDLKKVSKTVETRALAELETFVVEMRKGLAAAQKQLLKFSELKEREKEEALAREYDKKSARMTKELKKELADVMKKVLGRAISLEDHEKIVLERLEQLKESKPWK